MGMAYKMKYNFDGTIIKYNYLFVVKGYDQTHDINNDEVFAPMIRMTTIQIVMVLVVTKGWQLHHMDANNVFLQGDLKDEICM